MRSNDTCRTKARPYLRLVVPDDVPPPLSRPLDEPTAIPPRRARSRDGGPARVRIREAGSERVLVFLHGSGRDTSRTYGMLPSFVTGDRRLRDWDVYSLGLPDPLRPDVGGTWSLTVPLAERARAVREELESPPFAGRRLSLVAHSFGGLVLQRALVDGDFAERVDHLLLFGVPSAGLRKSRLHRFLDLREEEVRPDGEFLTDLARRRLPLLADPPFEFRVFAGLDDRLVPPSSSLEPFREEFRAHVTGDHLEMVRPPSAESSCVRRIQQALAGHYTTALPDDVRDPSEIVGRARAMELAGSLDRAVDLLRKHHREDPAVACAFAEICKRRWLASDGQLESEGQLARELYLEAFECALYLGLDNAAGDAGIEAAFMTLALDPARRDAAARIARRALAAKTRARPADAQRPLVDAEASLHLGLRERALAGYEAGWTAIDGRRRSGSIQQALWTARVLDDTRMEVELRAVLSRLGLP